MPSRRLFRVLSALFLFVSLTWLRQRILHDDAGLLVVVAVLALLIAASIVLDRMVPDEPAGKHTRVHARERRS